MRQRNKVPSYWWDFADEYEIVVESDSDKYPVVARFKYDPNVGEEPNADAKALGFTGKMGCAAKAIEQAEAYIIELNSGRVSPIPC